jgi:hypothetical protein
MRWVILLAVLHARCPERAAPDAGRTVAADVEAQLAARGPVRFRPPHASIATPLTKPLLRISMASNGSACRGLNL